jgi:hypothetical protein
MSTEPVSPQFLNFFRLEFFRIGERAPCRKAHLTGLVFPIDREAAVASFVDVYG